MALTVASLIVPAEAASASDHVENVSESIARLAPPVGSPVRVHVRDGVLVADSGSATLPLTGSGRLQIVNGKQDRPGLIDLPDVTLSLPSEAGVATARASVSNNGTVVYRGTRSVDVAVQATHTGVRVQTVIADSNAPKEYTYKIEGTVPTLNSDGSVDLNLPVGGGLLASVGHLDAPWAVDATGMRVPTAYRVDGSNVIQSVDVLAARAFPVVADPNFQSNCVWYGLCYIRFNKAMTNEIAHKTGIAGIVVGLTALSGGTLATVAAVVAARLGISSLNAAYYMGRNNCFGYYFPVYAWLNPWSWADMEVMNGTYNCA
jgi:hypothetical protein